MHHPSLPKRVTIELTNRCNRNCNGCPRHKMAYPQGDMKLELLEKIVNQLPPSTVIVPFFRGEALLHPKFPIAMRYLCKFKTVQFATNGDYLTEDNKRAIKDTCTFTSLSLHSFRYPEDNSYEIFNQVSILETLIPQQKREKFIREWLNHVERVRIYKQHSHKGFGDVYIPVKDNRQCCMKLWNETVVYWDGKVALCNHDWDNSDSLGDLNVQSVRHVWNGMAYRRVRWKHANGLRRKVFSCKDCDYWMTSYLPNKIFGELYTN